MVTESPRATAAVTDELRATAAELKADADLMDSCARRLTATAATLITCPAAPGRSHRTLERQAGACATAADQLRAAAEALLAHARP